MWFQHILIQILTRYLSTCRFRCFKAGHPPWQPKIAEDGRRSTFGRAGEPLQEGLRSHCCKAVKIAPDIFRWCLHVPACAWVKFMNSPLFLFLPMVMASDGIDGSTALPGQPWQGTNSPAEGGECSHSEGEPTAGGDLTLPVWAKIDLNVHTNIYIIIYTHTPMYVCIYL